MFVSPGISLLTVILGVGWGGCPTAFSTDLSPLSLIKEKPAIDMVVGTGVAQQATLLKTLS